MNRLGHKPRQPVPSNLKGRWRHHVRVTFRAGEERVTCELEASVNECPALFLREAASRLLELARDVEESAVRARVAEAGG